MAGFGVKQLTPNSPEPLLFRITDENKACPPESTATCCNMLQPSDILPRTLDLRFLTSPTITTNASARNLALDRGARTRALRNVRAERFCVTGEVPHSAAFPSDDRRVLVRSETVVRRVPHVARRTQNTVYVVSITRCMSLAEHDGRGASLPRLRHAQPDEGAEVLVPLRAARCGASARRVRTRRARVLLNRVGLCSMPLWPLARSPTARRVH